MKLDKVLMTIKKTQYLTVEVSEERGYSMPEGLERTFEFLEHIKHNYEDQIQGIDEAEAKIEFELEVFTVEEK